MICHDYKCVFIHIPKNAGQSVEHVFLNLLGLTWDTRAPLLLRKNDRPEIGPPRLAHLTSPDYVKYKYLTQEMFNEYFKFSFVRNPWSRMVSFYKYSGYDAMCDFKKFIMVEFEKNLFNKQHWFFKPQSEFIYDSGDNLLVDFVGRFENLQQDFDFASKEMNLPSTQLPHVNKSKDTTGKPKGMAKFCHLQKNRFQHYLRYQDYYDDETKDFVRELYERDIRLFKYAFE